MDRYVASFEEMDGTQVGLAGGKGANLGELWRIDGVRVPPGFCVTTLAFRRILAETPLLAEGIARLSLLPPDDAEAIRAVSAELRAGFETAPMPDEVAAAITAALDDLGGERAFAVRSSATAEDLSTASFAGQQDSFLNVVGKESILRHVSLCWGSLFSDRAVSYRLHNEIDHRQVLMGVVVQSMVFPEAAGVLFTADPISGNRRVSSIEVSLGLGEALVSGVVTPDVYEVRDGEVSARTVSTQKIEVQPAPGGGTVERGIDPVRGARPALTDAQALRLADLGRRIEAHFGRPQDIEWCLAGEDFQIVQSRPITTLFPVPAREDDGRHVYISVGHQQMMTDAMKPLGISLWQLTAGRPMYEAGSRLFVDVTRELATAAGRATLLGLAGRSDPLIGEALRTLLERGDVTAPIEEGALGASAPAAAAPPAPAPIETGPAIVTRLIERSQASLATLKREIQAKSGMALLDFIQEDIAELKRILMDPESYRVIMAAIEAAWWLNEKLQSWLGETNAADVLTRSVEGNITSEMGLALLEVADVIRPYPEVVTLLERAGNDDFLEQLPLIPGGREAREAIAGWLERYGMRGVGEIDITRPRWSERPTMLLPVLLGNVRNFEPGAAARSFEQGRREAARKAAEVLERLRTLPDGERKAEETRRMIDRVRTFAGYREYPKYAMISRYFVYRQALLEEARGLVRNGVLGAVDDIYYLTFQELREAVGAGRVEQRLIEERRHDFRHHQTLRAPRVLTSEGEAISGSYRRDDVPAGALAGLPVSAGTVEGRARVILDVAEADLEPGDILVTVYTDPSWTPLFVAVEALVTEVGGMTSHGSVIAREYGLPAVVGVEGATRLIRDRQRIRVHGSQGYVELLSDL